MAFSHFTQVTIKTGSIIPNYRIKMKLKNKANGSEVKEEVKTVQNQPN